MNPENRKRTWDWIGIIGIIIMILGCYYVYTESKVCHDPLKVLIEQVFDNSTILNYSYVVVSFYAGEGIDFPTEEYKITWEGEYKLVHEPAPKKIKYQTINLSGLSK